MRALSGSVLQLHLPERWPDLGAATQPLFRWARYDGARVDRGSSLLREIRPAQTHIIVAPSARILFARVRLPEGRAARQEKLLAFAVEDAIGANPEDIYAFHAGVMNDGETLIGVIDRDWLKIAVGELEMQGFVASRMVCESELLASPGNTDDNVWTVVRGSEGGFVHVGGLETLSLDAPSEGPPMVLSLALRERSAEGNTPTVIRVYNADGIARVDSGRWSRELAVPIVNEGSWQPDAVDARTATRTNLLAGITGRKSSEPSVLSRYKPALAIAAALLITHALFSGYDWWRLSSEQSRLNSAMVDRFKKIFPDANSVPNPPRQIEQKLRELRRSSGEPATDDMLVLLARVTPLLAGLNAQAKSIRYERGQLQIDIVLAVGESRESLEQKLRGAAQARVQIERIAPSDDGRVLASIKVSS